VTGEPAFARPGVQVFLGDCLDVLAHLPASSVDAVCTDPPYGLEFMGQEWDRPWAVTAKGNVGFTGRCDLTLPVHRDTRNANCRRCGGRQRGGRRCSCASPDWDREPADDMRAFQSWCYGWAREAWRLLKPGGHLVAFGSTRTYHRLTSGIEEAGFEVRDCLAWLYASGFPKSLDVSKAIATDDARRWDGWGTALKPAYEPILLARKPLSGTVAQNVLDHSTGALNIASCRIPFASEDDERESKDKNRHADFGTLPGGNQVYGDYSMVERRNYDPPGRWPANVTLDEDAAGLLGERSRFFYTAKADRGDRGGACNTHPTVKPVDLMRWLVRLVTPPSGVVLDPFAGSGTTGVACLIEGFTAMLIEREPQYVDIIRERLSQPVQPVLTGGAA
jgi:DNA modification methylase